MIFTIFFFFFVFRLLQQNVKYWSDINWLEITNKWYPGANCKVISTIFTWWVHNKVPTEFRNDVKSNFNLD